MHKPPIRTITMTAADMEQLEQSAKDRDLELYNPDTPMPVFIDGRDPSVKVQWLTTAEDD